jgi:hypothetical protein
MTVHVPRHNTPIITCASPAVAIVEGWMDMKVCLGEPSVETNFDSPASIWASCQPPNALNPERE